MTNRQAYELFYYFVNHTKLVWGANNTGCEAKADLMAEIAHEKGYEVSKIWVSPSSTSDHFPIYLNEAKSESTYWNYHVAIMLKIKNGTYSETMVLDPSLFDEPVKFDDWSRRISTLSDEYNHQLEFKESSHEVFFGPDDILSNEGKVSARRKRDEILSNTKNLEDPVVLCGFLMKLRGDFVDELMKSNAQKFTKLEIYLRNDNFQSWFKSPFDNKLLDELLNTHPRYYGIKSNDIKSQIDFSDVLASAKVKKEFWEKIGNSFKNLQDKSEHLLAGPSTPEAQLFRIFWKDDLYRASWFSPFNEKDWKDFGIDPETLTRELP